MFILRSSLASPFGRKVKISAALLGLTDRIEIVLADTLDPEDTLHRQNPLGKIPALILENDEVLYDSRVIVEYLDHLAGGGRIIPNDPEERFSALREQALADGILDAALLQVYEGRLRPEDKQDANWVARQGEKIRRGLEFAEAHYSAPSANLHIGHVALACALGYLDLRMGGEWRKTHPKLVAWLADFEGRVPAFAKTRMPS